MYEHTVNPCVACGKNCAMFINCPTWQTWAAQENALAEAEAMEADDVS